MRKPGRGSTGSGGTTSSRRGAIEPASLPSYPPAPRPADSSVRSSRSVGKRLHRPSTQNDLLSLQPHPGCLLHAFTFHKKPLSRTSALHGQPRSASSTRAERTNPRFFLTLTPGLTIMIIDTLRQPICCIASRFLVRYNEPGLQRVAAEARSRCAGGRV